MNFGNTPASTTATGFSFGSTNPSTFGATGGGDAGSKPQDSNVTKNLLTGSTAAPQSFTFGAQSPVVKPGTTTNLGTEANKGFFGAPVSSAVTAATTKSTSQAGAATPSIIPLPQSSQKPSDSNLNLSSSTKTTESTASNQSSQINFSQLEEHINKWTLELEEQEKIFTNQATQINAWDKLLITNNDKIVALNDAVQKVKTEQQTLEQELEFIATQHAELEESITPLQKDLHNIPQVDVERTQIYLLVENLDTQLKQMSEDLKEVIDYLNEANKAQDNTDPIVQIGKILNAHMSSLQWIESSSSAIAVKLDEISKMHESLRRDSERSFRLTYYD